jgi:hypothetical protein
MRKVILILMFLMFKVFYCKTKEDEQECCLNTNKATKNDKIAEIFLSDFNDLNELKFNCKDWINIAILTFQPNKPIIFDDSLDIKNLKIFSGSSDLWIILTNFKGIDLSSNPFNDLERTINFNFDLIFDFYVNKKLIDKTNCNDRIPSRSIIQQAFSLIVTNPNKNSGETCPFVFKNSLLKLFSIKFLRYSLIYTSSFTFQNKSIQNNNLNCSIFRTDLEIFHSDLNSKLLNAHVFRNLTILNIDGIINRIEADVFKNLKELRFLRIKSQNVKKIFSRDNKWFQYLNKNDVIERFYFFLHQLYENVTFYSYPEEDFCFFKYFPHQRVVLPVLTPNSKSKCSCTELFLIQNSISKFYQSRIERVISYLHLNYFNDYYDNSNKLFPDCVNNDNTIKDLIKQCEFRKRLKLCEYEEIKIDENTNLDIYLEDFIQFSDLIEIVFKKYLNLIFVIITLFINILMVVILSSKSLKDRMYTYLNINSVFNLLSCLITIIDYIASDCSGHCPRSIAYQYYHIILIKIIANSIKTCSNMAHLSFCLSRFKKIKGKDYIFIKSLNGLSFKLYLFLIITFSIGINLYAYFKFSIGMNSYVYLVSNNEISRDDGYSLKMNYINTILKNDYNKVNFSYSEYIILNIFQCLKLIFSDFTYIIATTVVDILLFKIVKKQMENKRKILINLNQNNRTEMNINKKKKENNKLSADHRISRMIILNGINYLLFRFPYSIFNFYVLIFRHDLKAKKHFPNLASFLVCHRFKFCQSIGEIFYFLYLISFFIQYIVFYKLDKNFKESCLSIVTKLKKIFNSCKNRIQNR